jgi:beta-fructofuranosidase
MSMKAKNKYVFSLPRSSLRQGLYTPAYGGFFEFDLQKERKISLRTLVSRDTLPFLLIFMPCTSLRTEN